MMDFTVPLLRCAIVIHIVVITWAVMVFICSYGLVPSILFVITDWSSNNSHKTILAAKALHSTGVMVFSIGIDGAQRPELEGIASDPSLVYQINEYSKLSSLQDIIADESSKCLNCLSLFCLTLFPIPLL